MLAPCLLFVSIAPAGPPSLEALQQRLARTAALFHDTALSFTCREIIQWNGPGRPGEARFEYVFVHEENEIKDYRTPAVMGKRTRAPEEISPDDYDVPLYLRSAYLWIFVFKPSRHRYHHYRVVGEEEVLGIPAIKIEFEPIPPYQKKINVWFGTAWVDPEMGQLLKVVAYKPDHYHTKTRLEGIQERNSADELRAEYETITTLFTEEKNGLRFPGKVVLDRSVYRWTYGGGTGDPVKSTLYKVEQKYRNYEFFSVRAAEEVRSYIQGQP